ncbi:hypothetical protein L0F63_001103 [Massospora cicadina]|nr:hypothetical protein L0F63_001103 [Massospora cicadina]
MLVCCQLDTMEPQTIDNELIYECFIQVIQSLAQLTTQVRIACGPWPPAQAMSPIPQLGEGVVAASIRLKECMRSLDTQAICFISDTWMSYEERIIHHIESLSLGRKSLLSHLDQSSTKIMDSAAALLHNIHHRHSDLSIGLVGKYAMDIGQLISMMGDFRVCPKHAVSTALEDFLRSVKETNKQNLMVMVMAVLRSSEEMITVAKALLANPSYARYVVADFCSLRSAEFQNSELKRLRAFTEALVRIKKRLLSKSFSQKQGVISTSTDYAHKQPITSESFWLHGCRALHQLLFSPSISSESQSVPYAPFLCRDYQENGITFNANGVTGGTLDALVEMLTPHDTIIDDDYAKTFLLTFRSFCTPTVLLEKLICRFNLTPPSGLMLSQQQMWKKHKLLPIRLHVHNILKLWLESYFFDSDDRVVLERIGNFVQGPLREALTQVAAAQLTELVHDKIDSIFAEPAAVPQSISKAVSKLLMRNYHISLLDIHPLEVARQLTLLVSKIFCSITPSELINREFSKPTHDSAATFVIKKAQNSTRITSLITRLILSEPEIKHRVAWIKFFIEVAEYLLSLRNYGTLVSIVSALQTSAVIRLRQTWKLVPEKHMLTMERLHELTNHARNYQALRKHLRVATTPCIPFLGIYLTDLTFADEGNPTYRTSSQGSAPIINFSKCQRIARIIQEIQRFQVPYNLIEVVELQTQFNLLLIDQAQNYNWSERHMYRLSLELEPRQAE